MSLEHAILGFLAERERSGYDLKTRCFNGPARSLWTADQAQIYRVLDRLQAAGLVTSRRKRQSGKPDRRLFTITGDGLAELRRWLASPEPLPPPREPFLLHLYFGSRLDDSELLDLFSARRQAHQMRLDGLRAQAAGRGGDHAETQRDSALRSIALEGAMVEQRKLIDWLDDCIDVVAAGELPGDAQGAKSRLSGTGGA